MLTNLLEQELADQEMLCSSGEGKTYKIQLPSYLNINDYIENMILKLS